MNVREWALPVYTILMQLSVGTLLLLWLVRALFMPKFEQSAKSRIVRVPLTIIFFTACVAMVGSHFHLSKPFRSFLAVLNFRTSWLSREIIFTVLFFATLGCLVAIYWLSEDSRRLKSALGWLGGILGLLLVFCMSHIYLLPTQSAWNSRSTILSFYLTTLLLGSLALPAILLIDFSVSDELAMKRLDEPSLLIRNVLMLCTAAAGLAWLALAVITYQQLQMLRAGDSWAQTSFELLTQLYLPLVIMRLALPFLGITWLVICMAKALGRNITVKALTIPVYVSCICVLVGEILGRFLFYATHIRLGV